jgi:hypothetical protein
MYTDLAARTVRRTKKDYRSIGPSRRLRCRQHDFKPGMTIRRIAGGSRQERQLELRYD